MSKQEYKARSEYDKAVDAVRCLIDAGKSVSTEACRELERAGSVLVSVLRAKRGGLV